MPRNVSISYGYLLNEVPDRCPACGSYVELKITGDYFTANKDYLIVFCICPRDDCKAPVLLNYKINAHYGMNSQQSFKFKSIFIPDGSKIKCKYGNEKIISDVSGSFVEIYNQAQQAECYGLDLICGAGYRKAFEYLIKDYVSKDNPAEEIKDMPVNNVIEKYLNDSELKEIAKRAIWLGNDETHVVRKWEERDLKDLKELIDITVACIKRSEKIKSYNQEMPNKK
jgi:hypothetical protein